MTMEKPFSFTGSGLGCFWLLLWTFALTTLTCGLFYPWAYSALQRWQCRHTLVEGRQLAFVGTGMGFFWQWLLIMLFTALTCGLYTPWGYCRLQRWKADNIRFQGADGAAG